MTDGEPQSRAATAFVEKRRMRKNPVVEKHVTSPTEGIFLIMNNGLREMPLPHSGISLEYGH